MMKRTFTSLLALWLYGIIGLLSLPLFAQTRTPIWSENFNRGNNLPAGWLNESARNNSRWVVNAEYEGTNGEVTPDAPAEIAGAPRSNYLHVSNQRTGLVQNNAQYDVNSAEFSSVTTSWIDASFYRNVELKLWYLANGQRPDEQLMDGDFGYADIRFKGQEEWIPLLPELHSTNQWTQLTAGSPLFNLDHQQFQLRFVWISNGDGIGEMPSFSIDDMEVSGTAADTGLVIGADFRRPVCPGRSFTVDYTLSGLATQGTITVQLSDPMGSFAGATTIGTSANITQSTGQINCTLPMDVNASGAYRIRLQLSQTGQPIRTSFNAIDIPISPLPVAGEASVFESPICAGSSAIVSVSGYTGNVLWQSSEDGTIFTSLPGSSLEVYLTEPLQRNTFFRAQLSTPGCSAVVSNAVQVIVTPAPNPGFLSITPNQSCNPTEVELTLSEQSNDIIQYNWESSNDGVFWAPLSSTTEPSLRTFADVTTFYRVMVQSESCLEGAISNPARVTVGLEVICGHDPSDIMPGDTVHFSLVINGHNGQPVNIAFDAGDGSDIQRFENVVDIDGLDLWHIYQTEGSFEYQFTVSTDDGSCVGFCSGSVNVSNQSVFIVNKFIFQYCAGMSDTVGFVTLGRFSDGNQFQLEVSDAEGNFDTPRVIGQSPISPIRFTIPADIPDGKNYSFRIVSTAPRAESQIIMGNELIRGLPAGLFDASDTVVCNGNIAELRYQVPAFDIRDFVWLRSTDGVRFDTLESSLNEELYTTGPVTEPIYFKVIDSSYIYQCPLLVSPTLVVRPESIQLRVETTPTDPMTGDSVFIRLWITGGKAPYRLVASAQSEEGESPVYEENNLVNFPYVLKFKAGTKLSVPFAFTVLSSLECASAQTRDTLTILPFTENSLTAVSGDALRACVNDTNRISLTFTAAGRYDASNAFIIEASGPDGQFSPGRILATLNQSRADTYLAQFNLPSDLSLNTALNLRVRATAPPDTANYVQTLTRFSLPVVPVISRDGTTLTSTNNDYTAFQWFLNNEAITGATGPSYTASTNGQYVVEVQNAGGCKNRSAAFSYVSRSSVNAWQQTQLYPNPTPSAVTISAQLSTLAPFELELVNALGQVIWTASQQPTQPAWQYTLDLQAWPAGMYWLRLRSAEDQQAMPLMKIAR